MVFEIKIFFNFLYFLYILLCIYLTPSLWSHPTHGNRDLKNKSQIYTTWGCFYTSYSFSGQYRIKWTCIIFFCSSSNESNNRIANFFKRAENILSRLKIQFSMQIMYIYAKFIVNNKNQQEANKYMLLPRGVILFRTSWF